MVQILHLIAVSVWTGTIIWGVLLTPIRHFPNREAANSLPREGVKRG
jgi:putative copper export protein